MTRDLTAEVARLMGIFDEGRRAAESAAHPLLAREFATAAEQLKIPRGGGAVAWAVRTQVQAVRARATHRRLRRRLRAARVVYRLNLPLSRDASMNFAVTAAAGRIDRPVPAPSPS